MKTYIFTVKYTRASYCSNFTLNIYRVKNNKPRLVATRKGNTGSMRGFQSEALCELINCGELPKSFYNLSCSQNCAGGYYCQAVRDKGVQIFEL